MSNTPTTTAPAPGFFLNAALDTLATSADIEASAQSMANVTGELVRVFAAKVANGQDAGTAAVDSVAAALDFFGHTGNDVMRCVFQDMLMMGARVAAKLAS